MVILSSIKFLIEKFIAPYSFNQLPRTPFFNSIRAGFPQIPLQWMEKFPFMTAFQALIV
jgi:hypothetical protein